MLRYRDGCAFRDAALQKRLRLWTRCALDALRCGDACGYRCRAYLEGIVGEPVRYSKQWSVVGKSVAGGSPIVVGGFPY